MIEVTANLTSIYLGPGTPLHPLPVLITLSCSRPASGPTSQALTHSAILSVVKHNDPRETIHSSTSSPHLLGDLILMDDGD